MTEVLAPAPAVRSRPRGTGETLAEAVFERLRADVISGALAAGERLRIEQISARYGVGPTPLREALQRLCAEGLVTARGNRGFAVAPLRQDEFEDLTVARVAVEREALRLAIAQGDAAWEAQLVAAAWLMAREDAALAAAGDAGVDGPAMDGWERANVAFHLATVSACGSAWLLRVRAQLSAQAERYRRASVQLRRASRDLGGEHAAIARAVLDRDAEAACALVEAHFRTTARLLEPELAGAPAVR